MLAIAMNNGSHHEIAILETVKFQTIGSASCFSCKHPISRIQWSRDNSYLYFFAGNNEFYVVDPLLNRKIADFYERKKQVSCIHFEEPLSCLVVCFADGMVKVYSYHETVFSAVQELQLGQIVTAICFVKKFVVFGTASGKVMWWAWPLPDLKMDEQTFEEVSLSAEAVTHLYLAGLKYMMVGLSSGIV